MTQPPDVPGTLSQIHTIRELSLIFCGYDYNSIEGLRQENAGNTPDSIAPVETGNLPKELSDRIFKANSDPEERLKLMDMDGIHSELIQASIMLLAMRIRETAVANDCAEVFNDYCAEYVQHDPKCPSGTLCVG